MRTEESFSNSRLRNSVKNFEQPISTTSKFSTNTNPIAYRFGERGFNQAGSMEQSDRGFLSVTGSNPIVADTRSYQSITPSLPRDQRNLNSPNYQQTQEIKSIQAPPGNVFASAQNNRFYGAGFSQSSSQNILQSRFNSDQKDKTVGRFGRFNDSSLGNIQLGSGKKF